MRTPLKTLGGRIEHGGTPELSGMLERALHESEESERDSLTHAFHSYPARMHPAIARTVLAELNLPRETAMVLDPFCGSGTVLVEAMTYGLATVGIDLNPLALRVSETKTMLRNDASRNRFRETLGHVAERSEARVRERVPVRAPLSPAEARWFDPHVLKELAGLREEILAEPDDADRWALEMILSAIVVKFSKQIGDTTEEEREVPKRIRKGLVTEFFVRKGHELEKRWGELFKACPRQTPRPILLEGDARETPQILGRAVKKRMLKDARADLILTSPPYGGTYDYVRHHARRYAWLGLESRDFERGEIGARRSLRAGAAGERQWDEELGDVLGAMRAALREDAMAILLIGDGEIGSKRIDARVQVERLGAAKDMQLEAWANQPRPDWKGGGQRREHLLLLRAKPRRAKRKAEAGEPT